MTFGSSFGRTFSPTFQPKSVAAASAASTWWDLNGTITSCLAAYQPKGAASLTASKVNLANPGTYNATAGTDPAWDTSTGWAGGNSAYLNCGFAPPDGNETWTLIVRFSDNPTDVWMSTHTMLGAGTGYNKNFSIEGAQYGKVKFCNGGNFVSNATASGVACVAGLDAYMNGSDIGNLSTAEYYFETNLRFFANYKPTPDIFWTGKIQAAAVYNATLSAAQVASLSTAMAAL